jgi:hypothetical protein
MNPFTAIPPATMRQAAQKGIPVHQASKLPNANTAAEKAANACQPDDQEGFMASIVSYNGLK